MDLGNLLGHLSYSMLVHPGDSWAEMSESLTTYAPAVKSRLSPNAPFGISLRLSAASTATLMDDAEERKRLKKFLDTEGLYVYTVNAFPYGPFKGQRVMEQVYEPDWTTNERASYTSQIADILVEISPDEIEPTIQTSPLAFRPNVRDNSYVESFTRNLLTVVAYLANLEQRTGRRVKVALEPEPHCYLETTQETVDYFLEHIYSPKGVRALAELAGIPLSEAHGAARRYLGIVFDVCHQAVAFEDIPSSLELLEATGIPIYKLQEAAALWVPVVTAETVAELERFTETIYLSQTSERRNGEITSYLNLSEAIEAWKADPEGDREWRTHFHVPVFLDNLGSFRTTRFAIEQALAVHRDAPQSTHLEIETYTWDVLPERFKTGDITEYVTRELQWVMDELTRET